MKIEKMHYEDLITKICIIFSFYAYQFFGGKFSNYRDFSEKNIGQENFHPIFHLCFFYNGGFSNVHPHHVENLFSN